MKSLKHRVSEATYEFAASPWRFDASDSRCPHDSWLKDLIITSNPQEKIPENVSTRVFVRLLGAYHDGFIEITYEDVFDYSISPLNMLLNKDDWLEDQIKLLDSGRVRNTINWASGKIWTIECSEIQYKWKPFSDDQGNE